MADNVIDLAGAFSALQNLSREQLQQIKPLVDRRNELWFSIASIFPEAQKLSGQQSPTMREAVGILAAAGRLAFLEQFEKDLKEWGEARAKLNAVGWPTDVE